MQCEEIYHMTAGYRRRMWKITGVSVSPAEISAKASGDLILTKEMQSVKTNILAAAIGGYSIQ